MLIGEAPGEKEDLQARPFIGRTGDFFNKLLKELGIVREHLFITSSVKCRPPKNRDPKPDELETCREAWLWKQIQCIQPQCTVLLGRIAIRSLLGRKLALGQVHGQQRTHNGRQFLLTYHPTAAMRFPAIQKRLREDLKSLLDYPLDENEPMPGEEPR
jgi:DNA polymerase